MICTVAGHQRRWPFGRCSFDAVAVQSGWIDTKNMDLMHEYPRILWKYMKLRVCNNITNSPHKRSKSSEIARFQNFSDCSNRLKLLHPPGKSQNSDLWAFVCSNLHRCLGKIETPYAVQSREVQISQVVLTSILYRCFAHMYYRQHPKNTHNFDLAHESCWFLKYNESRFLG